jgi:hypothetical protein
VDGKTSNTSAFFAILQFATYALWRAQIKHQVTAKKILLENVTKIAAKVVAAKPKPRQSDRQTTLLGFFNKTPVSISDRSKTDFDRAKIKWTGHFDRRPISRYIEPCVLI